MSFELTDGVVAFQSGLGYVREKEEPMGEYTDSAGNPRSDEEDALAAADVQADLEAAQSVIRKVVVALLSDPAIALVSMIAPDLVRDATLHAVVGAFGLDDAERAAVEIALALA